MKKKIKSALPMNRPISYIPYDTKEYNDEFFSIFLSYSQNITDFQSKQHILQYVKSNNKNIEKYSSLQPKKYTPYGIYVKIQSDGIRLPTVEQKNLDQFINDLEKLNENKLIKKQQIRKEKNIKDFRQIRNFLGDLNLLIDTQINSIILNKKPNSDITDILKRYNLSGTAHELTKDLLNQMIMDVDLAKTKKDPQLVEGYSYMTSKQLTVYITFLENILSKIITISSSVVQKPRKRKPKKPDQLVKKLQIQEKCEILGLISKEKINIIGSNILYIYNTKTRFFTKYLSDLGFSVKGTTLLNANIQNTRKKKIRKPESLFNQINPNNIKFMESLWNSIHSKELPSNTRLSKFCIIVSSFTI